MPQLNLNNIEPELHVQLCEIAKEEGRSVEELVAEISAAFLCANCGISPQTIEQSAAYLQGWIKVLKGDKRLVVSAAGAAQKSADLILGEVFTSAANGDAAHLSAEQQPVTTAQRNLFPD